MTTCTSCGTAGQPEGARFCFSCGGNLQASSCTACGAEIVPGARFCSSCGAVQGGPSGLATPVVARRITSVLFGDLVGFTSLSESRDQEDVRELLSRYFEECRQIVGRYGGTVEKFIGDAVMAVWGVPTAHEDDAERAVRSGLELVNAIAAVGTDIGVPGLSMRVGIVTGEVAVTVGAQSQGMVAGDAVNTASRVQSVATPGQVWVDETTRLLTSSAITYVDAGAHQLKGKADPLPLWSVRAVVAAVGGAQRADGLEAPHVGRDRELRLLKEVFHGVQETHRPALLVVGGEPGVGKSRLGWEFEKYADGLSTPVRWHSGRCLAYGEGVAYFALAEAVRARLQTVRDEDVADDDAGELEPAQLLEEGLARYVPDPEERAWLEPRMGALLGIGSVGTFPREDLFSAWTTFLHRVSEDEHPVVLIIDDAHHADDGLVMFIEHLLAVGTFPCFVALFSRGGLLEDHPGLATNRRATVLHLEALGPGDMGTLLDGLVAGLPRPVRESLVRRAEGIPLFAVETVRSLIDRDLVIPRGGQYVLANPEGLDLDAVGAPASLQALITARLDTLSPQERRIVDQASVVGNAFSKEAIARLCADVPDLDAVLGSLVRLQILQQEGNRFSAEHGQYQFVQSAVRQVAYGSLARRDRKASHLAVVRMLEAADEMAGELAPIIAQHYLEALDAVPDDDDRQELTAAAIEHLRRAAARSAALGAPAEAAAHLDAALSRATGPEEHAAIELALAHELLITGSYDRALGHAAAALESFEAIGDPVSAGAAAATLSGALAGRGENEAAIAAARPHYEALRDRDDAIAVALDLAKHLHTSLMRTSQDLREISEDRVRLAERYGDETQIADSYTGLSIHYFYNGVHGLSRLLLESAAAIARRCHDTATLARALVNLAADWIQEDVGRAVGFGREGVEVSRTTGHRYWISSGLVNFIIALWLHGDWDEATTLAEDDALEVGDRRIAAFLRGQVLLARGQEWSLPAFEGELPQDEGLRAWMETSESVARAQVGDPGAVAHALAAVERCYHLSGLFDDFTVIWTAAVETASALGDDAALDRLLAYVDDHSGSKPANGLRAHHQLLRARRGVGVLGTAEVEALYRGALTDYERWGAPMFLARGRAEVGTWLLGQGRPDEAAPLLAQAREAYATLGAVRWAADLDDAVAAVRV